MLNARTLADAIYSCIAQASAAASAELWSRGMHSSAPLLADADSKHDLDAANEVTLCIA